ncbi:MAG TPA: tyrosine-type recombinase/integrase [Deferrisomatales bacterium]|nr:tyrosine-type recombinase/integrase [Deferrisomatales bacterium]
MTDRDSELHVEPIRSSGSIHAIKTLLAATPRDLLLFTLGINNGVRAGDLLRVTVNDVRDARPGVPLAIRDKRAGGEIPLVVPPGPHRVLGLHLERLRPPAPPDNMFLFASGAGWTPLKTAELDRMVRLWTAAVGLEGSFGAHTLRKTFGYHQRTRFGVGFEVLAPRFGHASPAVTARYLGLENGAPAAPELQEL